MPKRKCLLPTACSKQQANFLKKLEVILGEAGTSATEKVCAR